MRGNRVRIPRPSTERLVRGDRGRRNWLVGIGVALLMALGVALGLAESSGYFGRGRIPDATLNAATDDRELREVVEGLRESLEEQIRRHEELRVEIVQLRAAMLEATPITTWEAQDEVSDTMENAPNASQWQGAETPEGFDDGALLEAGLRRSDAERLREAWEQVTAEEIALKEAARREGWFGRKRYRRERRGIWSDLRAELGEDGFDAVLFATGQSNRVVVTNVITRSSAAYAGFEKGDQILRYAGRRVFSPRELEKATASGVSGSTVAVEVLREGRKETLTVKRGPLGVVTGIVPAPPVRG